MTDHSEKLFAAAVRSLADDAELQLTAVALLEKSADRSKDGADEAIARWESVDAAAKRRGWRWVFVAVLIGLSVWAWSVAGNEAGNEALVYSRLVRASSGFQYDTGSEYRNAAQMLDACLPERLTQHERWLLLGDTTKNTRAESMKSLWEALPTTLLSTWIVHSANQETAAVESFLWIFWKPPGGWIRGIHGRSMWQVRLR